MGYKRKVRALMIPGGIETWFCYGNDAVMTVLAVKSLVWDPESIRVEPIRVVEHGRPDYHLTDFGLELALEIRKRLESFDPRQSANFVWSKLKEALKVAVGG